MIIHNNIEIIDLALFLKKQKTLILADLHLGFEEHLNKRGILIPRFQFNDTIKQLEKILKKTKPKTIIINGDLKHEYGSIQTTEWKYILNLIDFLFKHTKKIIIIKGNHDVILEPILKKRNLEIKTSYSNNNIYITHGHRIPESEEFKKAKTIIIAHEHPAVTLKSDTRTEIYKCFLKGKYKRKTLIVQPSFNSLVRGTDILRGRILSPFLKQNLKNFEIFIIEDKIYSFGKLKNIS